MPGPWFVKKSPRFSTKVFASALTAFVLSTSCTGNYRLVGRSTTDHLTWLSPESSADARALDRWRRNVGPALIVRGRSSIERPVGRMIVVSWNTEVGSADVSGFLRDLHDRHGTDVPLVLLLQEVYRKGADVPRPPERGLDRTLRFASGIGLSDDRHHAREDIATIAASSGLNLYYAPSMRNGSPLTSDEDRGNAILSSFPLSELTALELPFERQRRVAIAATVTVLGRNGAASKLRVVSAHLDNVAGLRRLWLFGSELARTRQARGLVSYLTDTGPTVVGGDFNTWFGFSDRAYDEMARAFDASPPDDRRATFRGLLRLDHVFFRLPDGWRARSERGRSRFGSDHYPLIATIDVG